MQEKLKRIKELLEKSIDDPDKKELYTGQALGMIDSLLVDVKDQPTSNKLPIPDMVWKHTDKPNHDAMMDAVKRHKEIHSEISRDSITQKNTQFEQLK